MFCHMWFHLKSVEKGLEFKLVKFLVKFVIVHLFKKALFFAKDEQLFWTGEVAQLDIKVFGQEKLDLLATHCLEFFPCVKSLNIGLLHTKDVNVMAALNRVQLITETFGLERTAIVQFGFDLYPTIDAEVILLNCRQL